MYYIAYYINYVLYALRIVIPWLERERGASGSIERALGLFLLKR